jgi:ERF superfamily
MHRSSPSIAALATALAKAQVELTNPEKSLSGTIEPERGQGSARQFRYAPLSSGLDIARKTLGQHEIAILQTTAIDQAAGVIKLTTVLAHSSGDWIASDWPVCPIGETDRPHRMGTALTYARRYALFTLVGIAGEDDLDAPGLTQPEPQGEVLRIESKPVANGGQPRPRRTGGARANHSTSVLPIELSAALSASLRAELLREIEGLSAPDDAALWAQRKLPAKNQLSATDARQVEEAFASKLEGIQAQDDVISEKTLGEQTGAAATQINKSVPVFSEPRRVRDRDHIRHVIKQPCLVCGRRPSDPHHLRFAQSRALGRKAGDQFTVPLCRVHHREVHRYGNEESWWRKSGIDPLAAARALWLQTHPLPRMESTATHSEAIGKIN